MSTPTSTTESPATAVVIECGQQNPHQLPTEIWMKIFEDPDLDAKDLANLRQVNRFFRNLTTDPLLIRKHCQTGKTKQYLDEHNLSLPSVNAAERNNDMGIFMDLFKHNTLPSPQTCFDRLEENSRTAWAETQTSVEDKNLELVCEITIPILSLMFLIGSLLSLINKDHETSLALLLTGTAGIVLVTKIAEKKTNQLIKRMFTGIDSHEQRVIGNSGFPFLPNMPFWRKLSTPTQTETIEQVRACRELAETRREQEGEEIRRRLEAIAAHSAAALQQEMAGVGDGGEGGADDARTALGLSAL